MKKIMNIGILASFLVIFMMSCDNDIDNYSTPNGGIKGTIYDEATNEPIPLPVEGKGGVFVNLYEQKTEATKPIDFKAKQDGTYENSQVFNCDYKVVVNGPFIKPCEEFITVKGQTKLDLFATPYSRIVANASVDGANKVSITYTAVATETSLAIDEIFVIWNFAKGVDINTSNYASIVTLNNNSGTHIFDLPNDAQYKENHYKIQANGNKVYVRVAAKIQGIVNYSKVIELIVN